jgi:hypothetical protein
MISSRTGALLITLGGCAQVHVPEGQGTQGIDAHAQENDGGGGGAEEVSGDEGGYRGGGGADLSDGGVTLNADGPNCGRTTFALQRVPPDVLILLDRSLSMEEPAGDALACQAQLCNSKWIDMKHALTATVTASQYAVNWGLKLFPSDDGCGVTDDVSAPVAPDNANAVVAAMERGFPNGQTPTRLALEAGQRYLMTLTRSNPRYMVLATDGVPDCGPNDGTDETNAIAAVATVAAAKVPVFVIGIATQQDDAATATLNAMARAGGKPRAADPAYYPVSTADDLSAALVTIGGQIVSCTLSIKDPPDPSNIAVDADGMRVPHGDTDGWTYGATTTTIELRGSWCSRYQSGAIKSVQAIFGCPGVIIP